MVFMDLNVEKVGRLGYDMLPHTLSLFELGQLGQCYIGNFLGDAPIVTSMHFHLSSGLLVGPHEASQIW